MPLAASIFLSPRPVHPRHPCVPQVLSVTYGEVPSDNGGVDKGPTGFQLLLSKNLRANDIGVMVTGAPYTNRNDGLVTNNGIVSSLKVPMKVDEVSGATTGIGHR